MSTDALTVLSLQDRSQTLTFCASVFLAEIKRHGEAIDFNVLEIAKKTRDYIEENPNIPIEVVYYEVATYALKGRKPRTVRYWVEAIAGFSDKALAGWYQAGLTMEHFTTARKLYRDEFIESPAEALDACINEREQEGKPLTVQQMENLFDPSQTEQEETWHFREWLLSVLNRPALSLWPEEKQKKFLAWREAGREFLK